MTPWLRVALLLAASLLPVKAAKAETTPLATMQALYPEGPVVIDGDLFVAEMTAHHVTRLKEDAKAEGGYRRSVFFKRRGCGPTALAELSEKRIAVLCHLEGAVVILDRAGNMLRTITRTVTGEAIDSPNDISADGAGGAYFSNSGQFHPKAKAQGKIMRLAPDLTVETVAGGLFYANGVAVDRARRRVLVSEHLAKQVLSYSLSLETGKLSRPLTLIDFKQIGEFFPSKDPLTGPDGIEIAPDGAVYVAIYGGGGYLKRSPLGVLTGHKAGTRFLCSLALWNGRLALAGAHRNDRPPYRGLIELIRLPN